MMMRSLRYVHIELYCHASTIFVWGYQDLLDMIPVDNKIVFYCHFYNEMKGENWKVRTKKTGTDKGSEFLGQFESDYSYTDSTETWALPTRDGDNIFALAYNKRKRSWILGWNLFGFVDQLFLRKASVVLTCAPILKVSRSGL